MSFLPVREVSWTGEEWLHLQPKTHKVEPGAPMPCGVRLPDFDDRIDSTDLSIQKPLCAKCMKASSKIVLRKRAAFEAAALREIDALTDSRSGPVSKDGVLEAG